MTVEQRLCRLPNRTRLFGRDSKDARIDDPDAKLGRMLGLALKILDELDHGRPSLKEWSMMAGVGESALSRFLAGRPTGSTPWNLRGAVLLRTLLVGSNLAPSPELVAVADRMIAFFFRDTKGNAPRFFRGLRARCPDPWSATELASEIFWLARQASRAAPGKTTRLVICSGGSRFLQGDHDATGDPSAVGVATHAAACAGVEVAFIFRQDTLAARSVDAFRSMHATASLPIGTIQAAPASPIDLFDYLTPVVQFMFFESWEGTEHQTALYTIRGWFYEERSQTSPTDDQPIATISNPAEARAFKTWYDRLRNDLGIQPDRIHAVPTPVAHSAPVMPLPPLEPKPLHPVDPNLADGAIGATGT